MKYWYTPQPVLGKRADTIFIDDVETQKKRASEQWLVGKATNKLLYGTTDNKILKEMKKPSGIMSVLKHKENVMEIGGSVCHLCGASLLQENRDTVYKKKQHKRMVKRYECGTIVEKSYKSVGEGYECENMKTKVILGDDCVEI